MKKTLMVLGGVFAVLLVTGIIGFAIIATKGNALDKESRAYVDQVTPIILSNLNKDTLFTYASDELKNSASPEDFQKMFTWFARLGQFKGYKELKGQANISITTEKGKQITAVYQTQAEFEKGPATISITTIKKGDKWQILGFHINSLALAN